MANLLKKIDWEYDENLSNFKFCRIQTSKFSIFIKFIFLLWNFNVLKARINKLILLP